MEIIAKRNNRQELEPTTPQSRVYVVTEFDKTHDNGWWHSFWTTKAEAIRAAKELDYAEAQLFHWDENTEDYEPDEFGSIFFK